MGDKMYNTETLHGSTGSQPVKMSASDKFIALITEPSKLFAELSNQKHNAANWLIPILFVIVFAALSNFLMMSNPAIKQQVIEKQMAKIESNLDEMVAAGQIPQSVADEQLEVIRGRMIEQIESGFVMTTIMIVVVTFILFFIVAGVFHLLSKFILRGEGSYNSSLTAYGLPYYILAIQILAMLIYALATDNFIDSTSVAYFLNLDTAEFAGYILGKVDPFSILFYSLISIAFARMYKAGSSAKYFLAVFGTWLGFSMLFFFAAQEIPLLRYFIS